MHIIRSPAAAIPEPRKQLPRFWKFAPGRGQLGVPRRSVLELDLPPPFPQHRWAFGSSPSLQVKALDERRLTKIYGHYPLPPYKMQVRALFFLHLRVFSLQSYIWKKGWSINKCMLHFGMVPPEKQP